MIIQLIAVLFIFFAPDDYQSSEQKSLAEVQHMVRHEVGPRINSEIY